VTAGDPDLPGWWHPLAANAAAVRAEQISRFTPPDEGGRPCAVLILLGQGLATNGGASVTSGNSGFSVSPDEPDVLLLERSHTMRSHAGQPAFPGGVTDPGDDGPIATALREANEEVGLDPATVAVVSVLPALWLPPSNYVVTPVLGWWRTPHPVFVRDPGEVAKVERVPVSELADPANRLRVRHPSGYTGPAFSVRGMLVWGFTAGLLSSMLDLAGWAVPWDRNRFADLPPG
jgi:8-oxo-dGTP pyrophosphatase MutT (NUDIX family)